MAAFVRIKLLCFKKNTLHSVKVMSSANAPLLFTIVFRDETNRSSSSQMFFKIDVQKFRKFHRKTPVLEESLFNKVAGLKDCNFIKKRLQHRCFPVKFANFLRTPFFTEHLR